jgi:serine/threonine-protein kinase HipA
MRVRAGELAIADRLSTRDPGSAFRYTKEYLAHPLAFPFDPQQLPLSRDEFICHRSPEDIHSVFEDSLPDAWGRRLLAKQYGLTIKTSELAALLTYVSGNAIGALSFGKMSVSQSGATVADLGTLIRAAELFEKGENIDKEFLLLFGAGSSPGGGRPKALVADGQQHYLAKFPSIHDRYDMVALEAATMTLAKLAGLNVCDIKVVKLATTQVLLVKRFDVTEQGGRNHIVSLRTLVGDRFHLRYQDILDEVRRYSDYPEVDIPMLFRQMCFNALIGNTDDHIKNFAMLHGEKGWQLTPAFDLLPNVGENPEHALQFLHTNYPPSIESLVEMGTKLFSISKKKTTGIVIQVQDAISDWANVFIEYNVPEADINRLAKDIKQRLGAK